MLDQHDTLDALFRAADKSCIEYLIHDNLTLQEHNGLVYGVDLLYSEGRWSRV